MSECSQCQFVTVFIGERLIEKIVTFKGGHFVISDFPYWKELLIKERTAHKGLYQTRCENDKRKQ